MKQHDWYTTVVVDGRGLGAFDTFSGGALTRENAKRREGGQRSKSVFGGLLDIGDVTLSRIYRRERDHDLFRWLHAPNRVGQTTITRQPLDSNGSRWGQPIVYSGILQAVNPGESDSDSADIQMFEIVVTIGGSIA